jgi:hypothetical protein
MVQDGPSVAGSYHLSNNTDGSFNGIRDGSSFKADFYRRSPLRKWVVEATWKASSDFVEIIGAAQPLRLEGENFIKQGTPVAFYAAARSY